ncbi:MAG: hypothetical protein M3451_12535 [Chloroflexota bacterium]|nr:hypothetical protein [Chloroflexota bacterium]
MVERIQGLISKIPGYDAYNSKESMRDDDRRLRDQVARRLDEAVSDLTSVSSSLAAKRQLGAIGAVEDLVRDTRLLGDRVRTASYGYEGLFSDRKVDEFALGQLKAFDVAFDAQVDALVKQISSVGAEGDEVESQIRDVGTTVDNLDRLFNARNDVITTATPSHDPNVLNLLEAPVTSSPQEQQLLRIATGGTVAILGDNFQISAHITVKDRDDKVMLSLLRLDSGPDWLAAVRKGGVNCWRVQEAQADAALTDGIAGNATVSGPQGTQQDIPAKYDVRVPDASDSPSVTIHLAIGGEARAFSGSKVPLIDIEVFSEGTVA